MQEPRRNVEGAAPEEREQIRRNLDVSHKAAWVGGSLGAAVNFATGNVEGATILVVGLSASLLSWLLLRHGRLHLSAVIFQICFVSIIHALCAAGDGVRDTAMVLYPLAIVTAALVLDRGLLVAVTAACITSSVILVTQGGADLPDWGVVLDIAIILVVSGVAVNLLLRGLLQNAAEARTKERRLAQAYRDLEARNAELERFTYVVSHDLKSPLVTIRGFLDYVEQDARAGDTERLADDVERIRVASDRMGRLLDDLLELSRTGRIERPPEAFPFGQLVHEARTLVDGRLASRGVQVELTEDAAARVVHGYRSRLVELLQNLLDNAAKFAGDERRPRVVIGLRENPDGDGPVFTVSDNGLGIDPAYQERVFELFTQLDPEEEGTGLGLALGRRIVETHGGRLWVESEGLGRGATFCFTLPPGGNAD